MMKRIRHDERGGTTTEYILVIALIAVACIGSVVNTGSTVRSKLNVDFASVLHAPNFAPTATRPTPTHSPTTSGEEGATDGDDQPIGDDGGVIHNPNAGPGGSVEEKP
jgi:Flp pilus assembly pilin Flp